MSQADAATIALPRDAATLVLLRAGRDGGAPQTLMGQRGAVASFMPNKVVFPGGGVEDGDLALSPGGSLPSACRQRLTEPDAPPPEALALAAIRETFEETGLRLARRGDIAGAGAAGSWAAFSADGAAPALDQLRFFFRAVTPPVMPKRFDARFFLAPAAAALDDPDDFARAGGELSHLAWTPLSEARALPLPFITNMVIEEILAAVARIGLEALIERGLDRPVPFFRHAAEGSVVDAL